MTRAEALAILVETESDYNQMQRVLRGLQILAKYTSDLEPSFEHDQMWVANFEHTVAKMTREDIAEMASLGWFENYDSWSHF